MQRTVLLGVPFDRVTMGEAVERVLALLNAERQSHVMTPNAEMLVAAARDAEFLSILRSASLNVADGIGVVWLSRIRGEPLPERIAGVDLVTRLAATLPKQHSLFLLGAAPGVAERAADSLRTICPGVRIAGTASGTPSDEDAAGLISAINASGATLLLVAYGAPAQDLWIHRHRSSLHTVRVAIGVGGTFDFLAGKRKRAPVWMRRCGLEWLWRLAIEPQRIGRILNAVVVFPLLVLRYGARSPLV